ncbi:MAG TPA: ABC transporter substrate-binding protein [Verrucomicrobiae bacterium]|nr:ABC transporter substrate-binding protein [Verrucomicrobiae bacterium]
MGKLRLSMACSNYDRTRALFDGRVRVEGLELNCLDLPIEEIFFRMLRHHEFDVAEISLSSYVLSLFGESPQLIAIPVFPSRFFRHSCIFIHSGSGIREPRDLIGKRVGVPEFQMTAGVWIRGILSDDYKVPVGSVKYFRGGEEEPGRSEKIAVSLLPEIHIESIPQTKTLSAMLESGEIDALYTARAPSTFGNGSGKVLRLFENYQAVEQEYFSRTKIFPIMHTIVIRRDVYEKDRWVAQSLYRAFAQAQQMAYEELYDSGALHFMLPWLVRHAEETRALMGANFWPYGLERNTHTLEMFLRYSHEQGLAKRLLKPAELFAPESLESFKV